MGVTEDYRDLEGKINPTENGSRIIMKSEINSCLRKPRHYYTIITKAFKLNQLPFLAYHTTTYLIILHPSTYKNQRTYSLGLLNSNSLHNPKAPKYDKRERDNTRTPMKIHGQSQISKFHHQQQLILYTLKIH